MRDSGRSVAVVDLDQLFRSVGVDARRIRHTVSGETGVVCVSAGWPDVEPRADHEPEQAHSREHCTPRNAEQPERYSDDEHERQGNPPQTEVPGAPVSAAGDPRHA